MLKTSVNAAVAFLAIISGPLFAGASDPGLHLQRAASPPYDTQGGFVASPGLAARSALPSCGFAAVESWGPNGFQYCDGRNVRWDGGRRPR